MANQFTKEQIERFKKSFAVFDQNGDEKIDIQELDTVMRNCGQKMTKARLQEMMFEADLNGDGTIDFSEYLAMVVRGTKDTQKEEEMRKIFLMFDDDGNGFITARELGQAMVKLGVKKSDAEINAMVQEADTDGDDKINYAEFRTIMASMKSK